MSNGDVVCWYRVAANSQAVFIRTQANESVAGLRSYRANATRQGEHPKTDLHFKPDSAFSTSIGSATYGFTYSVTVLKKRVEVSVGAVHTTLAKVETLTRLVLPLVEPESLIVRCGRRHGRDCTGHSTFRPGRHLGFFFLAASISSCTSATSSGGDSSKRSGRRPIASSISRM